ncbi:hypothetical protein BOX15_Mlig023819g4 [Macrostomum lignano]|uniref:RRM domain-containing protein n=1 Tax=Macrostomum lignano TaxID=282301 RepID=A0A267E3N6_9PLAT|nr:hypothetical protein BOX15_Mlig023819g4 [Macrostomum lignano]
MYDSGNHKESHSREDICCRLFIGGLSPSVTSDSLHKYFSQYGTVQHCNVPKDPKTQRSKGYGFLTYKDRESVDSAQLHRPHVLDGRQVETKRAMPREEANNPEAHITTKKLFVGALRKDVTDQLLRDYFSAYGTIVDAYIVRDNATGDSRGFGFVVFDDYDPVDKVMLYKPHLLRAGGSVSITDVKKGLTKEELASAHLREQQQSRGGGISGGGSGSGMQANMGGPPGAMMMSGGAMGPWGPMMGPMMGGGSGPKPQQQQHGKQPQAASSKPSKSPAGAGGGGGPGPNGMGGPGGSMGPYGPMGMMGMMGPGPMGPMGMMGPGPMGPMGMMGPGPMGPMGMMGPGPMGQMGMMGPGFGFYPNQCGGYGPMGRGGWGGFRSSPYSMMPPHRTRSNST